MFMSFTGIQTRNSHDLEWGRIFKVSDFRHSESHSIPISAVSSNQIFWQMLCKVNIFCCLESSKGGTELRLVNSIKTYFFIVARLCTLLSLACEEEGPIYHSELFKNLWLGLQQGIGDLCHIYVCSYETKLLYSI